MGTLALLGAGPGSPAVAPSSLLTGLVAYWEGLEAGGNLLDSVGTEHLTDVNTVTSGAGRPVGGTARQFTASSLEHMLRANDAIVLPGTGSLALAAWVNHDTLTANQGIGGIFGPGGSYSYLLYFDFGGGAKYFFYASANGSALSSAISVATPSASAWHLLIGWFDVTAGTINLQVDNGTPVTTPFAGPLFASTSPFYLGRWSAGEYLNGRMAGVGLWKSASGPPLSTSQRTSLWASGNGILYPFTGVP